jgi:hypothetical protein
MKYVGALRHEHERIPTLYYAVAGAIFPLSVIVGILRDSLLNRKSQMSNPGVLVVTEEPSLMLVSRMRRRTESIRVHNRPMC